MIETRMDNYFSAGQFRLGVNYWASHAGTAMWTDWRPDSVRRDLDALAGAGVQVLRVFPLWPDFQPLNLLYGGNGEPKEYRHGEDPWPDDPAGRAGVSPVMMERFGEFERMADRRGLKLMVGLITGWMSGRLFVPPALEGRNALTDPVTIMWQQRFVGHFVERFRNAKSIVAWDLGNETNCMAPASREQAWVWSAAITDAIRSRDDSRPVVSGMHGLTPHSRGPWRIQDQGEITDLLTTHPYPPFTPHCDLDPIPTMRPCLHATAESRMYGDIGGKPCMAEEFGTLGPAFAGPENAAAYLRTNLFSLLAHDCRALLWWCAFDQHHLAHAPYDWCSAERELGMFGRDRSPKLLAAEFGRFGKFLRKLPGRKLPPRTVDGVCLLSPGQDSWGAAYSSFILAKQAGFDIAFRYGDQDLGKARVILVPSLSGQHHLSRRRMRELRERVKAGATLYISADDAIISGFAGLTGLEILSRERRSSSFAAILSPDGTELAASADFRTNFRTGGAEILAREPDGNPVLSRMKLGKGRVCFLSFPLETMVGKRPGALHGAAASPYWRVYAEVFSRSAGRALSRDLAHVGVTEHPLDGRRRYALLINYSPEEAQPRLALARGWRVGQVLYGTAPKRRDGELRVDLPPNGAAVLKLDLKS